MKTKIQIKTSCGTLLYEHEAEDNNVKKTIEEAVKKNAYLGGADLRGANLSDADLRGAYLRGAYLRGANLSGAYLSDAYLGGAYLRGADLSGANLRGANLGDWGKIESASDVLIVGPIGSRNAYTTVYHTDKRIFVQCGCFRGTLDEFAAKVKETHAGTKHERDYNALIDFVKIKFSDYDTKTN
jgi:hypothetical protein